MVRFIMPSIPLTGTGSVKIYIPIWLDLLSMYDFPFVELNHHLHSNMVRFIIYCSNKVFLNISLFTFQYG